MTGRAETSCPRCGYDLSGAVAAWGDSCPLTGVCSECGLELWWGDVLNPSLTVPKWSFEHSMRRRARRLMATWLAGLRPWRFWRDLRMEHEIRPWRLLVFALTLSLLVHLGYSVEHGWRTYVAVTGAGGFPEPLTLLRSAAWPYGVYFDRWRWFTVWPSTGPIELAALALVVGAPLAMLALPDTFKLARVRRVHILRGAVYSAAGPAVAAIATAALVAATVSYRQAAFWRRFCGSTSRTL